MIQIKTTLATVARQPLRAHPTDAGADLQSVESYRLYPGTKKLFDTGIAIAIPEGFVGFIIGRSGLGSKGIKLGNSVGVIDSSYRGNLKILLENDSHDFTLDVVAGETKLAQLVILPTILAEFKVVDSLDDTVRGTGGFGSTGA